MGIWWYQGDFTDEDVFNTRGIDVTDEAVVQYDVAVVKILLQVLIIYNWSQINFDVNTYVLFLDSVLCIVSSNHVCIVVMYV